MPRAVADPSLLSPEERELMVAAAASRGQLRVCTRSDTHGRAVCTKDRPFVDAADRAFAQRYLEALQSMEQRLLMRQCDQRGTYELTNTGWQISRALTRAAEPTAVEGAMSSGDVAVGRDTPPPT